MEVPSQDYDTVLLPHSGAIVEGFWNELSLDFSQCVNREQGSGGRNTYQFLFSGVSLTYHKEHSGGSCEGAEPQAANQLAERRGAFWLGKAHLGKLLVLAPVVMSLAVGNGNLGWGEGSPDI